MLFIGWFLTGLCLYMLCIANLSWCLSDSYKCVLWSINATYKMPQKKSLKLRSRTPKDVWHSLPHAKDRFSHEFDILNVIRDHSWMTSSKEGEAPVGPFVTQVQKAEGIRAWLRSNNLQIWVTSFMNTPLWHTQTKIATQHWKCWNSSILAILG